ncbi:unnamed protein product [Linum trigynum]|uniref:Pentatricopeptide repeat-containing protein n=1 Tax=Linum trigynum TaxID=586398 RepID=A0AAV2DHH5_9ROSI
MSKAQPQSVYRRLRGAFDSVATVAAASTQPAATTTATSKPSSLRKMVKRFKESSESQDFRSRFDVYLNSFKRLAKYGKFSLIEEIVEHQKKFEDITGEQFVSRLIVIYGRVGMFKQARKLFDEMPDLNCPRTVYSFNALLSACIDSGEFDQIDGIVKDLPPKLGITLDVVSHNTIMKGFCKMGALDSAASTLDEMMKKGVSPSVVSFNTLLNAFYRNGRFEDGESIWNRMAEMDVAPDIISYNSRMLGLALVKRVEEAEKLIDEMGTKGIEPDGHSFSALIQGYVKDDNLEAVKRWYREIEKNELAPNKAIFKTLVPFLCEKSDLQLAFELCRDTFRAKCGVDVKSMQLVVDELTKESKVQEAEELVQLAKKNKYKLIIS